MTILLISFSCLGYIATSTAVIVAVVWFAGKVFGLDDSDHG